MVLYRGKRRHITRGQALLQPLCGGGGLRNQSDEGLDGRETRPRDDSQNIHRPRPVHHRQRQIET